MQKEAAETMNGIHEPRTCEYASPRGMRALQEKAKDIQGRENGRLEAQKLGSTSDQLQTFGLTRFLVISRV